MRNDGEAARYSPRRIRPLADLLTVIGYRKRALAGLHDYKTTDNGTVLEALDRVKASLTRLREGTEVSFRLVELYSSDRDQRAEVRDQKARRIVPNLGFAALAEMTLRKSAGRLLIGPASLLRLAHSAG